MIFVTVGTHEQPFNRLIHEMDFLKKEGIIGCKIMMQIGYSTYIPTNADYKAMLSYEEMLYYIEKADIVVTHGGPSSFALPLTMGKIPIVVPRQRKYNEHVNNHQLEFIKEVEKRNRNIIAVYDIEDLKDVIMRYSEIETLMKKEVKSHTKAFNESLIRIIDELWRK